MKSNVVNIFVDVSDMYFLYGVTLLLGECFTVRGANAHFVNKQSLHDSKLLLVGKCRGFPFSVNANGLWGGVGIFVRGENGWGCVPPFPSKEKPASRKSRRIDKEDIERLVEMVINPEADVGAVEIVTCPLRQDLSPREREVLYLMSWETSPNQLGRILKLSPKTVSAHKRGAMRKLGFRRSHELYSWLRQGGLEREKRVVA